MKKAVALFCAVSMLTVFFCASVSGASVIVNDHITHSTTVDGVNFYVSAMSLHPADDPSNLSSGQYLGHWECLITVTITNNNTVNKHITFPSMNITLTNTIDNDDYKLVQSIENFSNDLQLVYRDYNSTLDIVSSADWSYNNGFVIPAKSNFVLITTVRFPAIHFNTANVFEWRYEELLDVALSGSPTVTTTDAVVPGTSVQSIEEQITDISEYLSDTYDAVDDIEGYIDDLESRLASIISLLTWSGTTPSNSESGVYERIGVTNQFTQGNANAYITRYKDITYREDTEFILPSGTYNSITKIVPYQIYFVISITSDITVSSIEVDVMSFNPDNDYKTVVINSFYSDTFTSPRLSYNSTSGKTYLSVNPSSPLTIGSYSFTCTLYQYIDSGTASAITTTNAIRFNNLSAYGDSMSETTEEISDTSDTIHSQEAIWYSQNQSAIEATGLSNYNFSNNINSGILEVAGDFMRLWNKLGTWTNVYTFSLTLSLALMIIRHVPSSVNRRRKQKEE